MREPKFAKFPGGACPQSPLEARAFGANNYSLFSITWGWNLCECVQRMTWIKSYPFDTAVRLVEVSGNSC